MAHDPVDYLEDNLGYHREWGNANKFSRYLGRPAQAWCFDAVTAVYDMAGHRLPSMQPGCATGGAYVKSGIDYARAHHLWQPSWDAKRNDAFCFDFGGRGDPKDFHIALVKVPAPRGKTATYIGGNQSDEVSERQVTVGSNVLLGSIRLSHFLQGPGTSPMHDPGKLQDDKFETPDLDRMDPWQDRWPILMMKTPYMHNSMVGVFQQRMIDRGWKKVPAGTPYSDHAGDKFVSDSDYGPDTAAVVWAFQKEKHLGVDGQVGKQTWEAARRKDNVTP